MSDENENELSELLDEDSDSNKSMRCTLCNGRAVKKISTCPGCNAPYHRGCISKTPMIQGVGLRKCCGAPSPTQLTVSNPALPALASIDQLRTVVREENEELRCSISRVELSISNLTDQMTRQNDKIEKCESFIFNINARLDMLEIS